MARLTVLLFSVGCGGKLDAPLPPEAGADAGAGNEMIDSGNACVPFDGTNPPHYTSGVGCFSTTVSINGQPACAASGFAVACVGDVPQTPIPSPGDAGDCTIIGIPTPQNALLWCCRCAF